jgi:NTP pyrophosphatase (non-canonical NTP hydrolase)
MPKTKKTQPRNVPFQPNLEENYKTAHFMADYLTELAHYRENRHRPKNNLYYVAKLGEEVGELSEAVLASEGSRRKVKKLAAAGVTPRQRMVEELGDVVNVAFLLAEQFDIPLSEVLQAGSEKLTAKRVNRG